MNDCLMDRLYSLSRVQNIPDVKEYALSWRRLAADFRAEGRESSAGACDRRAEFYELQPGGEYLRIIEGPLSELVPAEVL